MPDTQASQVSRVPRVKLVPMARRAKEAQEDPLARMAEMDILARKVCLVFLAVREKLENLDRGVIQDPKDLQLRKINPNLLMGQNQVRRNPSMYTGNQIK